ncbi:MAG TPA: single-stranded DNA-binding protein [Thermoanaerobaculia bacterium]|nr:single-stranded DNA-binding protein [Thermoanaerobaculia bacterium]
MNHVTLIGYVGGEVESGEKNGQAWARFSLATNEVWTGKDGEKQGRTDWHQVVAFNGLSKTLGRLGKGDLVAVDGKLRTDTYEKDGEKRRSVRIMAREVKFLRLKDRGHEETAPPEDEMPLSDDGDIPF